MLHWYLLGIDVNHIPNSTPGGMEDMDFAPKLYFENVKTISIETACPRG